MSLSRCLGTDWDNHNWRSACDTLLLSMMISRAVGLTLSSQAPRSTTLSLIRRLWRELMWLKFRLRKSLDLTWTELIRAKSRLRAKKCQSQWLGCWPVQIRARTRLKLRISLWLTNQGRPTQLWPPLNLVCHALLVKEQTSSQATINTRKSSSLVSKEFKGQPLRRSYRRIKKFVESRSPDSSSLLSRGLIHNLRRKLTHWPNKTRRYTWRATVWTRSWRGANELQRVSKIKRPKVLLIKHGVKRPAVKKPQSQSTVTAVLTLNRLRRCSTRLPTLRSRGTGTTSCTSKCTSTASTRSSMRLRSHPLPPVSSNNIWRLKIAVRIPVFRIV